MLPQSEDRSDDCPPRSEEWSTFLGKVGRFCNKLRNHNETGWHLPGFIMRKWDAGQVGWQVWSLWLRSQLAVAHWEHTCITGPPPWNCNVLTTSAGSFEPFLLRTSLPSYACLSQHNTMYLSIKIQQSFVLSEVLYISLKPAHLTPFSSFMPTFPILSPPQEGKIEYSA